MPDKKKSSDEQLKEIEVEIDDALLEKAIQATGINDINTLVTMALQQVLSIYAKADFEAKAGMGSKKSGLKYLEKLTQQIQDQESGDHDR